jgi:hypothetical protein
MSDERQRRRRALGLLGRICPGFSSEPRSREDLREIVQVAMENDIIDEDALSIIDGAMQVSGSLQHPRPPAQRRLRAREQAPERAAEGVPREPQPHGHRRRRVRRAPRAW